MNPFSIIETLLKKHDWELNIRPTVTGKIIIDVTDIHDTCVYYSVGETIEYCIKDIVKKFTN